MNKDELLTELDAQTEVDFSSGRRNHLADLWCSFGAIAFSFIAAIVAATQNVPAYVVVTVAGLSGLFTTLQRVIDFRGRAAWYFSKEAAVKAISRGLRYENLDLAEASRRFGELEVSMEHSWGKIGRVETSAPTGRGTE